MPGRDDGSRSAIETPSPAGGPVLGIGPGRRPAARGMTNQPICGDSSPSSSEGEEMDSLVIHAVSRQSADQVCAALIDLHPRVVQHGRYYHVEIHLGGGNRKIIQALNRLEEYVSARADGPAQVDLSGHHYTLHPN